MLPLLRTINKGGKLPDYNYGSPQTMTMPELTKQASADAQMAGVSQMTPEKRQLWATLDNQFAVEKLRRKAEEDNKKRMAWTTYGLGNAVQHGQITPEVASDLALKQGIDYPPELFAKHLPVFRTHGVPSNVPLQSDWLAQKATKANIQQGLPPDFQKLDPETQGKILKAKAETAKLVAETGQIGLPPIPTPLQAAQTEKTIKETGQIGQPPPLNALQEAQLGQIGQPPPLNALQEAQLGQIGQPPPLNALQKAQIRKIENDMLKGNPLSPEDELIKQSLIEQGISPTATNIISTKAKQKSDTEKTAPQQFYQDLSNDHSNWKLMDDISKMMVSGGAGAKSTGLLDSIWMKVKKGTGTFTAEEEAFNEKYTELFGLLKQLNQEARMSDKDYDRLKEARPSLILNNKAFKASIERRRSEVAQRIKKQIKDLKDLRWRVPSSYDQFSSGGFTQTDEKELAELEANE